MPLITAVSSGSETHTQAEGLTPPDTIIGTNTAIAFDRCIVMFTLRAGAGSQEIERMVFVGNLADVGGNIVIEWSRKNANNTAVDVTVEWFVYEFTAGALTSNVQRGENDNTSDTTDITISSVTANQTMYLTSYKSSKRSPTAISEIGFQISLFSATVLRYYYNGAAPETGECEIGWQVIEFKSADIKIQHGITSFTTTGTQAITGFTTLANMFVLLTGIQGGNSQDIRSYTRIEIDSTSQISFDVQNQGTPSQSQTSWSVFEFLDGGTVEKGQADMNNGDSTPTQPTFTALDEDFAGVLTGFPGVNNCFNPATADDGNFDAAFSAISLDSGGAGLTITRGNTSSPINVAWVVVEWKNAVGAVFIAQAQKPILRAVPRASYH